MMDMDIMIIYDVHIYVILLYRTIPTIPEQHTYQTTNLCTTLDRIMVCTRGKILAIPLFGGDNQ